MIEIDNLSKDYGPRRAIDNLSFRINKGEVVGFLGPNGAGKTTTMNILACIMPSSSGTARVCGYDVFENSLEVRKRIGYLPENPPLYKDMPVSDYLEFTARLRHVPGRELAASVAKVLEDCSLTDVAGRIIGRLSKGYQQRVGLAQAMIHSPDILILDEPTVGLDPIQIIEIRKLIQELAKSHTIILSSHILPEITQICKRVIILNEGKIAAMDSLDGLSSSLGKKDRFLLKVRNPSQGIEIDLKDVQGVCSVHEQGRGEYRIDAELNSHPQDRLAGLCLEKSWGLVEIKKTTLSLEDIFLKLTLEEKETVE